MPPVRSLIWILALAACGTDPTAHSTPAAVMLGRWQYATPAMRGDGPSLNAGFLVTLVIDSVDRAEFSGHVERWFSGDVGVSPNAFGPIAGSMLTGDRVELMIPFARYGAPTLRVVGVVANDVLTVGECQMGEVPGPFPVSAQFVRLDPRADSAQGAMR